MGWAGEGQGGIKGTHQQDYTGKSNTKRCEDAERLGPWPTAEVGVENEQLPWGTSQPSYSYSPAIGLLGLSQRDGDLSTLTWTHTLIATAKPRKNKISHNR